VLKRDAVTQVARRSKIINPNTDDAKYMINVKQIAKFSVVAFQ
jgi:26S proteasome regulatory subunit T1